VLLESAEKTLEFNATKQVPKSLLTGIKKHHHTQERRTIDVVDLEL
jgi:hypothetical protein